MSKRRAFNRDLPEVRGMILAANRYGFNRGSESDSQTILYLLEQFAAIGVENLPSDVQEFGQRLAADTVDSDCPMAADVAWALASLLSNQECLAINRAMSSHGVNMAGTFFSDEFPKRIKRPILGKRIWNWRIPAAFAAGVLIAHAEEMGLRD